MKRWLDLLKEGGEDYREAIEGVDRQGGGHDEVRPKPTDLVVVLSGVAGRDRRRGPRVACREWAVQPATPARNPCGGRRGGRDRPCPGERRMGRGAAGRRWDQHSGGRDPKRRDRGRPSRARTLRRLRCSCRASPGGVQRRRVQPQRGRLGLVLPLVLQQELEPVGGRRRPGHNRRPQRRGEHPPGEQRLRLGRQRGCHPVV
jgi:hypothetical protein